METIEFLNALILGVIEGITEFLPISSTGHLILGANFLGLKGDAVNSFIDAIQSGAIMALLTIYPARFKGLFDFKGQKFTGLRALSCLALSTMPAAVIALLFEKKIKTFLFAPGPVALALAVGAIAILILDRRQDSGKEMDEMSPALALKIGLVQCLALWPGMSRSACTILGGMGLGLKRAAAVEYSFLAACPLLLAATAYEFLKHYDRLAGMGWSLGIGFLSAFLSAFVAVKVFVRFVSKRGLAPFAWYRLVLAMVIWRFWI